MSERNNGNQLLEIAKLLNIIAEFDPCDLLTLTHVTPKSFGSVMFIVCLLARYICQSQLFRFLEDILGLIHAT